MERLKRHHEDELTRRLESVYLHGCGKISREELCLWYNRKRLTNIVWQDIHERWKEIVSTEPDQKLGGHESAGNDVYVLFNTSLIDEIEGWY